MSTFWSPLAKVGQPVYTIVPDIPTSWQRIPSFTNIQGFGFGQGGFGQGGFGGGQFQSGVPQPNWSFLFPSPVYSSITFLDSSGSQWIATVDTFGRLGTQVGMPVLPTLSKIILTMIDENGFLWDISVDTQGRMSIISSSTDYPNVLATFVLTDSNNRNWTFYMGTDGRLGSQ